MKRKRSFCARCGEEDCVSFIVEKDGSVSNAKVQKSVSEELDAEALRVVNAMPKWTPGMQKGQAVRVKYNLPVTFKLQ